MPILLPLSNKPSTSFEKEQVNNVKELENQLEQGSIQAAIDLTAITGYQHDESNNNNECYQCNKVANYFILAFQSVKSQPLALNETLLTLVSQTIDLIQSHNRNTNYTWLTILMKELRDLGKRIRDETILPDTYIPLPLPAHFELKEAQHDTVQEQYGRAIRIAIYHCRAASNIYYYRKCLSVLPSPFETKQLQQSAKQRLMAGLPPTRPVLTSSHTWSTVSSNSSTNSDSTMSCANCGVERKRMPVCSKCRSQSYCSLRCLNTHKPIHTIDCSQMK